ncbi:IS3 family transposase [Bacillus sp. AFS002410]
MIFNLEQELIQALEEYIHFYKNERTQKRLNRFSHIKYKLATATLLVFF